ncbi:type IV secretion system chaperone VirE1 [Agrobacterium larrymoorei]|uniref:Type IV secretion system protein VirE1 n=1 Tax=Agrobacterium larrymoorei TaxID=160699 RepID=A0A4D7E6H9_9HYPH|nr:type IV secretion system chaperone VirE1 [Agrobacterium larrymoorei]QCJ00991.1 type IV secretion system protein VirE1 [Agrobacterium larrymoorei]QYA10329.1 type IV secretion system protein VirE1 [Agrobacterium larrymoorei]
MAIIKLNTSQNVPELAAEEPRELHIEKLNKNYQPDGFTSLDLDMIELENFVLQCPLPEENLVS